MDSASHPMKESFFAGNLRQLHNLWRKSGANKDSFQAFLFFLPTYADSLKDCGLKHGLMALTVFHSLLNCQEFSNESDIDDIYEYFRKHWNIFLQEGMKSF